MTDTQARADRAQRLLEDPELIGAFNVMRAAIHHVFSESPLSPRIFEMSETDFLKLRLATIDGIWDNLEQVLKSGKAERYAEMQPPFLGDLNGRAN